MTALGAPAARVSQWVAAVLSTCYVALFAVLTWVQRRGDGGINPSSDIGLMIPAFLAAAGCFWAARGVRGRTRVGWLLLAGGMTAYAVGTATWTYYRMVLHTPVPFPSPADAFFALLFPFAIAGLLVFPSAPTTILSKFESVFDAMMVSGSLMLIGWTLVLSDVFALSEGGLLSRFLGLAAPIAELTMCTLVLHVAVRARPGRRLPFSLLALALLTFAVTDFAFAYLTSQDAYESGSAIDAGYVAASLLILLAGVAQLRQRGPDDPERTATRVWARTLLPYVVLLPALAIGTVQFLSGHTPDAVEWAIGFALLGMLIMRQFLTLAANVSLTRRLRTTVGDLRSAEADMRHQAFHDALTGLANRPLFRDRITHAIAVAQRQPWEIAVLFLDLDDFKVINDTLGHEAGDELLIAVGARLRNCIRGPDTAARLGGDEFAVLLEDGGRLEALRVAQRLANALEQPFALGGQEVIVRASVGIATPGNSTLGGSRTSDADELLRHADLAMYSSKYAGKGRVSMYEESMGIAIVERLSLKTDLTRALLNDEFTVYFQPVVDLGTGQVTSVEALARWHHPARGLLVAEEFMPLAEDSGLIVPLGLKFLNLTCGVIRDWHRDHSDEDIPQVSVNLSSRQLADPAIADDISVALLEHELQASTLILEITENTLMSNAGVFAVRLRALKAMGVSLAIDKFGTGQSSLASLDQFPVDILKMDRSFVAGMTRAGAGDRHGLAAAVLRLGAMLDLQTVATGVEQPWQLERLRDLGCTAVQGYYIGCPQPADALSRMLRKHEINTPRVRDTVTDR